MGRGGHTNQTGVTRHAPSYSSDAAVVGGGSGPAPEMANACLIGFREEVLLNGPSARGARAGLNITLVPGAIPGSINIMAANGARLGVYDGEHKSLLAQCMRKKYVYRGVIDSVRGAGFDGQTYAKCDIQGLGLV